MTATALSSQEFSVSHQLAALLDAELDYSVGAQGGYVNHLAMTLVAAARLGADSARLEEIYRSHASDDFLLRRPRPDWLVAGTEEVARRGISVVVRARLPALLPALDARWFHAVIRLEHAIEAEHPGQLAHALGDWEQVATPLPDLPTARGEKSLLEVARRLEAGGETTALGNLRFRDAAAHPWVTAALEHARLGEHALDDAAELALWAHVAGNNIGTLHLVTGARAARAVARWLPEDLVSTLGARLAQAVLAGYLSGGTGRLPSPLALEELRSRILPDWSLIAERAVASDDSHVTKLVYACRLEEQTTGDRLYQWLAARSVELV